MTDRRIPRTAAAWVSDPWWDGAAHPVADHGHSGEYPTHSRLLGPDGRPLEYEPRPRLGFDLSPRNKNA